MAQERRGPGSCSRLGICALALAVSGCSGAPSAGPSPSGAAVGIDPRVGPAHPHATALRAQDDAAQPATSATRRADRGAPTSIRIPDLGISSAIVPVRSVDRVLEIPPEPWVVGWWADGARPGEAGTVLLAVHRDTNRHGPGPFAGLASLAIGAVADIGLSGPGRGRVDAWHRYVVSSVALHRKGRLPAGLFSQEGSDRVVLVTCGGRFRRDGGWDSNLVVTLVRE